MQDDQGRFGSAPRHDVGPLVRTAIGVATLVTLAMIGALGTTIARFFPADEGSGFGAGPLVGLGLVSVAGLTALALTRLDEVSWWVRGPIVLAITQLAIGLVMALAWYARGKYTYAPALVDAAPIHWYALGLGAVVIAAGALPARRRGVPTWLTATVVFALADLLATGVLAAFLSRSLDAGADTLLSADEIAPSGLTSMLLRPALIALVIAAAVTFIVRRRAALHRRLLPLGLAIVPITLLAMVALRDANARAVSIYESYLHVIAGSALFALCALVALAMTHGRALRTARRDADRPAPWVQRGSAPPVVGHQVFEGWLAGFSTTVEAFELRTDRAVLPIARGARLVAPLGPWTATAAAGEHRPIVADGAVTVTGFTTAPTEGPFRAGAAPIPSDRGQVVTVGRNPAETIRRDLVLLLWRPCLLFLVATILAALPGLTATRNFDHDDRPRTHRYGR